MPNIQSFEKYAEKYEDWFAKHKPAYKSELLAIKSITKIPHNSVEIGIGSGLFASKLGIQNGIDPSKEMLKKAQKRGLNVILGTAESLPWNNNSFAFALMVTTICFVDDAEKATNEVYRILKPGGKFVNGFVDKDSQIGNRYQIKKDDSLFYRDARFFGTRELLGIYQKAGFKNIATTQTLFGTLDKIDEVQKPRAGYGAGSFVVIKGTK